MVEGQIFGRGHTGVPKSFHQNPITPLPWRFDLGGKGEPEEWCPHNPYLYALRLQYETGHNTCEMIVR